MAMAGCALPTPARSWHRPAPPAHGYATRCIDRPRAASPSLPRLLDQKSSVAAPDAMYSTTFAAVTILAPEMRSTSVMPRGLVHAPQAQICPPLATNASITSSKGWKPSSLPSQLAQLGLRLIQREGAPQPV